MTVRTEDRTGGREEDEPVSAARSDIIEGDAATGQIIAGLGGRENIQNVDCCFTRLRVKINDMQKIDEKQLKQSGASGFVRATENDIQVIYGPQVESIASAVKQHLLVQQTQ